MYQTQPRRNPFLTILVSLLIAGVFFVFGYSTRSMMTVFSTSRLNKLTEQSTQPEVDFDLFWKVWSLVKSEYVQQPVADETLLYGAIQGIAGAVNDPYTIFLNSEDTAEFETSINGEFEGIGAEIGMKEGQLVVIAPLRESPAEQAGLQANDAIVEIDGVETAGMSIDEAVNKIRGPKNTQVVLSIYRIGAEDFQDISITRAVIEIPVLESRVEEHSGKQIGIIILSHFNTNSSSAFIEAANELLRQDVDALILDVRNNPGGLLDESITISSQFIEDGTIVTERFNDNSEKAYPAKGQTLFPADLPLVVLINTGSASASEIVAGAIQDHERGTIIGSRSYGKASVQDYRIFDDGSSLKMTVAEWFTPNGTNINKQGITPDIEVEVTPEDRAAKRDPQFERAVEELTKS